MSEQIKPMWYQHSDDSIVMALTHRHHKIEMYYLMKGNVDYYVDDRVYNVSPGCFVIISPGVFHRTQTISETRERILINFDIEMISEKARALLDECLRETMLCIPETNRLAIENLLAKLENEYGSYQKNKEVLLEAYLTELLALVNRYSKREIKNVDTVDKIVIEVAEYINNNYNQKLTLKEISRRFNISDAYLSRKFKSVIGTELNNYIQFIRVEKAKELLRQTSMSVTKVSEQCGFDDSNYFSVVFKRLEGCSPNNYIKKMQRVSSCEE